MKDGYIKVAAATPDIRVADCEFNRESIQSIIDDCTDKGVKILVFPELCITGYTCGDLFLQDILIEAANKVLLSLVEASEGNDMLCMVGLPVMKNGRLYNVAAVFQNGELHGLIPKASIPNYSEFSEKRYFEAGNEDTCYVQLDGFDYEVPFGTNLLFTFSQIKDLVVGVEICEDAYGPVTPSSRHAMAGATIIANLSASNEVVGKDSYRVSVISDISERAICGYIFANAGEGESTTDLVFAGHNLIAETGHILSEGERFVNGCIVSEIDLGKIRSERRRKTSFQVTDPDSAGYETVELDMELCETKLTRSIEKSPFIPTDTCEREKRLDDILNMQAMGLKKRLNAANCKSAVVGISGGLDSTLALLVTVKAFDMAGLNRSDICAVTMPCFGTTDRTYSNAVSLIECLGATFREVNIKDSVRKHFEDIGHDENNHDVTYENSQARERTQILMDIANQCNGMVIGTGDMSELALGWATYNGDHMSMYGVNASVPKTLVRHLVNYYAMQTKDEKLKEVLLDILDTPVSPELLPPSEGKISQKTEDIVGPYELHDFFLFYIVRYGYKPSKVFRMAKYAFGGEYSDEIIYKWLCTFYRRFFTQQFKRSCLPDGPKVGSVGLSPRGDFSMPSDAVSKLWLNELELLGKEIGVN